MTGVNQEIRNRIRLSVAAFAYEIANSPVMSDGEFDSLAGEINPSIETGHEVLDEFFRTDFVNFSGVWIHSHPELEKVKQVFEMLTSKIIYDLLHNRDLFAPMQTEPPFRACSLCGKNTAVPITANNACCC